MDDFRTVIGTKIPSTVDGSEHLASLSVFRCAAAPSNKGGKLQAVRGSIHILGAVMTAHKGRKLIHKTEFAVISQGTCDHPKGHIWS